MDKPRFLNKVITGAAEATKSFLGLGNNLTFNALGGNTYRGDGNTPFGNSGWLFDDKGGMDKYFNYSGLSDIVTAYERCAPVFSIINKQAYSFTNGKTFVMNKKGKEATNEWSEKVRKLLYKPNTIQNGKQFEAQIAIYLRLFGYCVIIPDKPAGFPMEDAKALWIIPPYLCKFKFSATPYYKLKKYSYIESVTITYGNDKTVYTDMEELVILRDITPGFDNAFIPGSPIKPLTQNISNLIGIYDSKGVLINYRGALGILSPETDPAGAITMDPKEKRDLENSLTRFGLRSTQQKFIIANAAMQWQQMITSYRDLMLPEWAQDETQILCDGLNYPYELMSNSKTSSMNGTEVNAFKQQLYQDFTIPFAEMIFEQLGEVFNATENKCTIIKDFSHIQALQHDILKRAQSRKEMNSALVVEFQNNIITLNRWLEINGEDTLTTDEGKMYYWQLLALGWTFGSNAPQLNIGTQEVPPPKK